MVSDHKTFDTLIIGAGPVGLVAAIGFARAGHRVALVAPPSTPNGFGRTVALMKSSIDYLAELGLWDAIQPNTAPLARMTLIDDTGSLFRPPPAMFNASEINLPAFGYNIEVEHLVRTLERAAADHSAIIRFTDTVEAISVDTRRATVTLSDCSSLNGSLVVGADGRKSKVRSAAGITAKEWNYAQSALTTVLDHTRDHHDTSTEFHTREGPFTLVPLPGRRSSLVWLASPARAQMLHALDERSLSTRIEAQSQSLLGKIRISGPRGLVPMAGLSVSMITRHRAALVGEAAHAFPPIGAQGLNLGMRDVRDLVRSTANASDHGSADILASYQRKRSRDIATRTRAVDTLNRSLLSPLLPVDFARGFGLLAISTVKPLRKFIMRQGLGA